MAPLSNLKATFTKVVSSLLLSLFLLSTPVAADPAAPLVPGDVYTQCRDDLKGTNSLGEDVTFTICDLVTPVCSPLEGKTVGEWTKAMDLPVPHRAGQGVHPLYGPLVWAEFPFDLEYHHVYAFFMNGKDQSCLVAVRKNSPVGDPA